MIRIPKSPEERKMLGEVYRAVADVLLKGASSDAVAVLDEDDDLLGPVDAPATAYLDEGRQQNLDWFLREVTVNARRLIRAIAEGTLEKDVIWSTELREHLDVANDGTLGGWAASIGFASKRTRLPKPYTRNTEYGRNGWEAAYRMDPSVAKAVLDLVDKSGNVREES